MLPTSLCGMKHIACGQRIVWCAAFYGPIRVSSKCVCPETKAYSSSRGTAAHCLDVGTGLKRAVSVRPWPIYPQYWTRGNVCQFTASTDTTHFTLYVWTGSLWNWNIPEKFAYVLLGIYICLWACIRGGGRRVTVICFVVAVICGVNWCALVIEDI